MKYLLCENIYFFIFINLNRLYAPFDQKILLNIFLEGQ